MPDGPLRRRLQALAQRSGIGFSDVRIWNTHYRIINGAIVGPMRVARYVILSDALAENLTPREVEAVFAHELGHGYHRHILWYMTAIFAASLVSGGLGLLLQLRYPRDAHFLDGVTMVAMALFIVYGISWISRLCEHQADWFAAQRMGEQWSLAAKQGGGPGESAGPGAELSTQAGQRILDSGLFVTPWLTHLSVGYGFSDSPLQRGAEAFSSALRRVVEMSGRSPEKGGWMHPSVNQRTQLLAQLAESPEAVQRFEAQMRRLRRFIGWGLVMGVAMVCMAMALSPSGSQAAPSRQTPPIKALPPRPVRQSAHWVIRAIPKSSGAVEPNLMAACAGS